MVEAKGGGCGQTLISLGEPTLGDRGCRITTESGSTGADGAEVNPTNHRPARDVSGINCPAVGGTMPMPSRTCADVARLERPSGIYRTHEKKGVSHPRRSTPIGNTVYETTSQGESPPPHREEMVIMTPGGDNFKLAMRNTRLRTPQDDKVVEGIRRTWDTASHKMRSVLERFELAYRNLRGDRSAKIGRLLEQNCLAWAPGGKLVQSHMTETEQRTLRRKRDYLRLSGAGAWNLSPEQVKVAGDQRLIRDRERKLTVKISKLRDRKTRREIEVDLIRGGVEPNPGPPKTQTLFRMRDYQEASRRFYVNELEKYGLKLRLSPALREGYERWEGWEGWDYPNNSKIMSLTDIYLRDANAECLFEVLLLCDPKLPIRLSDAMYTSAVKSVSGRTLVRDEIDAIFTLARARLARNRDHERRAKTMVMDYAKECVSYFDQKVDLFYEWSQATWADCREEMLLTAHVGPADRVPVPPAQVPTPEAPTKINAGISWPEDDVVWFDYDGRPLHPAVVLRNFTRRKDCMCDDLYCQTSRFGNPIGALFEMVQAYRVRSTIRDTYRDGINQELLGVRTDARESRMKEVARAFALPFNARCTCDVLARCVLGSAEEFGCLYGMFANRMFITMGAIGRSMSHMDYSREVAGGKGPVWQILQTISQSTHPRHSLTLANVRDHCDIRYGTRLQILGPVGKPNAGVDVRNIANRVMECASEPSIYRICLTHYSVRYGEIVEAITQGVIEVDLRLVFGAIKCQGTMSDSIAASVNTFDAVNRKHNTSEEDIRRGRWHKEVLRWYVAFNFADSLPKRMEPPSPLNF